MADQIWEYSCHSLHNYYCILALVCWSVAAESTIEDKLYRLNDGIQQIFCCCHFMYTE
jgi:hypothetical protein